MLIPAEIAIRYASLGWLVIPVEGKKPIGNEWQKRASCDQATVARLFAQSPTHDGVGVQLGQQSGLIDFDCDSSEAEETLLRLFDGDVPITPTYQSARGKHRLFKWTARLPSGSIKIVIDGLEIRLGNGSLGCQTVFPPSGGRTWLIDPDDASLAEIPPAVIERINTRYEETHRPKAIQKQAGFIHDQHSSGDALDVPKWLAKHGREIIGRTENGDVTRFHIVCPGMDRHTTPNSFRDCCVTQSSTGKLGGGCFHSSCGFSSWDDLKLAIGPPDYSDYHDPIPVSPIFDPLDQPVIGIPITGDEPDEIEQPDEQVELNFPEECLRPPGLIGDFIDYTLGTARFPQPEHTLAAGLSLMSLITGRRVADCGGTRGNLMIVSLGPTRSGKEHPRWVIKSLLEQVNAVGMFEEKLASEAALYGFLKMSHAGLVVNDEFGDWLALARSKAGPNTQPAKILTAMTMLYSSSNCRFKAPRYAENAKQVELNQPHLVFVGTSTGDVFWKHVTPEYLSGGLFGRVMLFENRGYVDPSPMSARNKPLPSSLVTEIQEWLKFNSQIGDMNWENPTPFIVPHSSDAMARYEAHELEICQKRKGENAIRAALWSGTAEISSKLALLYACSRSRNPLQITLDDVDNAIRLSNWLTRRKISLCMDHVAENATEDAAKRIYRIIKAAGTRGIEHRSLTRKTQWLKTRDRQELLTSLRESCLIDVAEVPTKTKPKSVWIATIIRQLA